MTNLEKMKKDLIERIQDMNEEEFYSLSADIESYALSQKDTTDPIVLPESIFTCQKCKIKYKGECGDDNINMCLSHFVEHSREEYIRQNN